jgi:hypothetical protein
MRSSSAGNGEGTIQHFASAVKRYVLPSFLSLTPGPFTLDPGFTHAYCMMHDGLAEKDLYFSQLLNFSTS